MNAELTAWASGLDLVPAALFVLLPDCQTRRRNHFREINLAYGLVDYQEVNVKRVHWTSRAMTSWLVGFGYSGDAFGYQVNAEPTERASGLD